MLHGVCERAPLSESFDSVAVGVPGHNPLPSLPGHFKMRNAGNIPSCTGPHTQNQARADAAIGEGNLAYIAAPTARPFLMAKSHDVLPAPLTSSTSWCQHSSPRVKRRLPERAGLMVEDGHEDSAGTKDAGGSGGAVL